MMNNIVEPVIFLPGTLCDERVWMPCWRFLACQQRAYVPLQWAESMEHMLALCADRVEASNTSVHLVGFSMGGYVAAVYALQHPEKIASLTLVGASPFGLSPEETKRREGVLQHIANRRSVTMSDFNLEQFVSVKHKQDTALLAVIRGMESDLGATVLGHQIRATMPRQDLSVSLAKSGLRVYFLAGEEDRIIDLSPLKNFAKNMPNGRLITFASAGHMLPLEQPQILAEQLQTLLAK